MSFGRYKPKEYTHLLGYEDWYWKFKEPSFEDDANIERLLKRMSSSKSGFIVSSGVDIPMACKQISVTFVETNVPMHLVGGPFIKPMTPPDEIEKFLMEEVYGILSDTTKEFIVELWKEIYHVRPGWGPVKKKYLIRY